MFLMKRVARVLLVVMMVAYYVVSTQIFWLIYIYVTFLVTYAAVHSFYLFPFQIAIDHVNVAYNYSVICKTLYHDINTNACTSPFLRQCCYLY